MQMSAARIEILLLSAVCLCSAAEALRNRTDHADQPDFADYRQSGQVIRAFSGKGDHNHYGVTLRLRERYVRALASGTVYSTGELRGYGNVVIVDHGHGWHTLYSDIAETRVQAGQQVRRGSVIGTPRAKRLFLVVSYKGNPINPSDVIGRRNRNSAGHSERVQSRLDVPALGTVAANAG
jgi:murein DD-endopeptidase MepM/ murein hydrolase activator NlpD